MLFSLFHPFLKILELFHNLLVTSDCHMVNLKKKTKQTQLGAQIILAKLQRDAHMVDVKFELCKPLTYLRLRQNINKADICLLFFWSAVSSRIWRIIFTIFPTALPVRNKYLGLNSGFQSHCPKMNFSIRPLCKIEIVNFWIR